MIGDGRPRQTAMDLLVLDRKAPHINSVEPEHGHRRRKTASRPAAMRRKNLLQSESTRQMLTRLVAPVIKITSNDEWRRRIGFAFEIISQRIHLPAARITE